MASNDLSHEALFEALIFASPQPVMLEQLAHIVGLSTEEAEGILAHLEARLTRGGLRLQRHKRGGLQLVTWPKAAPYVERLLNLEVNLRLSQASLEALSIVAYAQPVTRPQIEAIRGVNSDSVLRTLMSAGLIEEVGRAESVGRPILYGTTFEFLQQFGLKEVDDLPPLALPDEKS
jgi:segregation and condensation protein B